MEIASLAVAIDSRQARTAQSDLEGLARTGARTEKALGGVGAGGRAAATGSSAAADGSRASARAMRDQQAAAARLTETIRRYALIAAGAFGARDIIQAADSWQGLENRLRLVTKTNGELRTAMDSVYAIAQRTSQEMGSVGQVYQRFAQNADVLNLSQERLASITETTAKAIAVSGSEAAAAQGALTQFGQALASGVLRGEEFNSVMEGAPGLAQALADGLGVPIGALRSMAAEGEITADKIVLALERAADGVDARFNTRIKTAGEAFTELSNATTKYLGEAAQTYGLTAALAGGMGALADNLDRAARFVLVLGGAAGIPLVTAAVKGLTLAVAANPIGALAVGASLAVATIAAFSDEIEELTGVTRNLGSVWDAIYADIGLALKGASKEVKGLHNDVNTLAKDGTLKSWTDSAVVGLARVADVAVMAGRALYAIAGSFRVVGADVDVFIAKTLRNIENLNPASIFDGTKYEQLLEQERAALEERNGVLADANQRWIDLWESQGNKYEQIALRSVNSIRVTSDEIALVDLTAKKARDAANTVVDSAKKGASAYQSLISSIRTKIEENKLEIAVGEKASEADKLRIKVDQELAAGKLKLTAAQKANTDVELKALKASESQLNISRMIQAAKKKELDLTVSAVKAAYDEAERNEELYQTFGMTADAVERLTVARLQDQLAQKEALGLNAEQVKALELLIEAHERNALALQNISFLEKQKQAWERWQNDVEQIFSQVGQSLTDAIFEGGKSGRELVKDLFKTLTLRVVINPVMNQLQGMVTNSLGGMFGLSNPMQQSGGGLMGTASSLNSAYNAFSGGLNQTLGKSIGWLGEKFGSSAMTSFATGLTGFVPSLSGLVAGPGLAASLGTTIGGTAMAATSATASVGAAGGLAGLGSAVGAALPWIGGALAVGSLLGGLFDGPPKTRHGQRTTFELGRGITSRDDRQAEGTDITAAALAQTSVAAANELFRKIGVDAAIDSFYAIMESSVLGDRDGVASGGALRVGDQKVDFGVRQSSDMTLAGFGGWSDAEMLPRLQTDIQLSVLEAFQAVGDQLPSVLSSMLKGVHVRGLGAEEAQALAEQFAVVTQNATALQEAVKALPFEQLRNLSFDAAAGLSQLFGGLENFMQSNQTFYQNFYTEAERQQIAISNIAEALSGVGVEMPAVVGSAEEAKAAWRALREAQDLNTESGRQAFAVITNLSGAFAEVANYAGQAAAQAEQLAQQQAQAAQQEAQQEAQRIADQRLGLELQLEQVLGQNTLARQQEIMALDESNRALQRHIWTLQDATAMLGTAYSAIQQYGQQDIARLQETFGATDRVWQAFQSSAQESIRGLRGVFDAVSGHIKALRGQVDSANQMQYREARALISTALVTGQLPGNDRLTQALQAAREGVTGQIYANRFEQEKAYLTLAAEMEGLQGIAEPQLSMAEAQLEELRKHYNRLRGIEDIGESSLSALEQQLRAALSQEESARVQIALIEQQLAAAQQEYEAIMNIGTVITDLASAIREFAAAAKTVHPEQIIAAGPEAFNEEAYLKAKQAELNAGNHRPDSYTGDSTSDLRDFMAQHGMTPWEHYLRFGRGEGIPGFASGGFHVGGLRLVGERGPELEVTGPARIYSASQTQELLRSLQGGGHSQEALIAENRVLQKKVDRLEAQLARVAAATEKLADQFDNVTAGGNAMLTEDAASL